VRAKVLELDKAFRNIPAPPDASKNLEFDETKPTAVILVSGYSGLGIHIFLNIFRLFPNAFKNVVFMSVAVINSDFFKDSDQLHLLSEKNQIMLNRYIDFSRRMGVPARCEHHIGTDVVESVSQFCVQVSKKYPHAVFFAGELIFENAKWYHKLLHNETAYAILRRIRFAGLPMVMIPARISDDLVKSDLQNRTHKKSRRLH
jgi:hypothetical protein